MLHHAIKLHQIFVKVVVSVVKGKQDSIVDRVRIRPELRLAYKLRWQQKQTSATIDRDRKGLAWKVSTAKVDASQMVGFHT